MDGDTILWVRTDCAVEGVAAELACNHDTVGRFSRVEGQLNAGDTVFPFVDSLGIGGRFHYRLTVTRL